MNCAVWKKHLFSNKIELVTDMSSNTDASQNNFEWTKKKAYSKIYVQ